MINGIDGCVCVPGDACAYHAALGCGPLVITMERNGKEYFLWPHNIYTKDEYEVESTKAGEHFGGHDCILKGHHLWIACEK